MTARYRHIRFEEIAGFTVCRSNHGDADGIRHTGRASRPASAEAHGRRGSDVP